MNPQHFRDHVIRPTLDQLAGEDAPWVADEAAVQLVLGTALAESNLTWLVQRGGGPARGVYQIEPETRRWLQLEYLPHRRPGIYGRLQALRTEGMHPDDEMVWNLAFATALARARYFPSNEPLPKPGDVRGFAHYWKRHYNTSRGMGTLERFVDAAGPAINAA